MSRHQALEILGLDNELTPTELDSRFRDMASRAHPDHGGSADEFGELIQARDYLRSEMPGDELATAATTLPAVSTAHNEIVVLEREKHFSEQRQEYSERVKAGLVRAEVSRLTQSRRRVSFLAWLGGGAGAITIALRATSSTAESYIGYPWVAPALIISVMLGAACAAASFVISGRISRLEQAIEDADETMNTRSTYLDLLYEILESSQLDDAQSSWATNELVEAVDVWSTRHASRGAQQLGSTQSSPLVTRALLFPFEILRRTLKWSASGQFDSNPTLADLAYVIGAKGFVRLLLAKGEETRLLTTEEEVVDDRLFVMHCLILEPASPRR